MLCILHRLGSQDFLFGGQFANGSDPDCIHVSVYVGQVTTRQIHVEYRCMQSDGCNYLLSVTGVGNQTPDVDLTEVGVKTCQGM